MSEEIKKFFTTYTDFVTKVTSDPSIDLEALKKSFNEIEESSKNSEKSSHSSKNTSNQE